MLADHAHYSSMSTLPIPPALSSTASLGVLHIVFTTNKDYDPGILKDTAGQSISVRLFRWHNGGVLET